MFAISGEQKNVFTKLTEQKRQLLSGSDPKLIGDGHFLVKDGKIWQRKDNNEILREVLCSYSDACGITQNFREDLGHCNSKDVLFQLQKKF